MKLQDRSPMPRLILLLLVLSPLGGCMHLATRGGEPRDRVEIWTSAHEALEQGDFSGAEERFDHLARIHTGTLEGRESLFYLGAIPLDPRNPGWNSEIAEVRIERYLALRGEEGPRLYRYPEARTLLEIARQLNLPIDERFPALQTAERIVEVQDRVLVPAQQSRALVVEIEQLQSQIAERDVRIRQQQEELERIRRTLTRPQ